jgi:phosphate transport system permease protein
VADQIHVDPELADPSGQLTPESLGAGDYSALLKRRLREIFPDVTGRNDKRNLYRLLSTGGRLRFSGKQCPAIYPSR